MKFSWKHDLCYYTSCHLDGPIKLMGPSIYRLPMPDPRWFLQRYLFKKTELRSKKCKINQLNIQLSIDPAPWMLNDTASPATDAAILWALGDFSTASILKSKWTYGIIKCILKKKKKSHLLCVCDVFMCTLIHNLTSSFHIRSVWAMTSPIGFLNIPLKLFKNLTRSGAPYRNA